MGQDASQIDNPTNINQTHTFQTVKDQVQTLTMVANIPITLNQLLLTPTYFWIDKFAKSDSDVENLIKGELFSQLFMFTEVAEAEKSLKNHERIVVICSLTLAEQVEKKLSPNQNIKQIICYCMKLDNYAIQKKQNKLGDKFKFAGIYIEDIKQHIREKIQKKRQRKELNQFLFVENVNKAEQFINSLRCTFAMSNQETNQHLLNKIGIEFLRLFLPQSPKDFNLFQAFLSLDNFVLGHMLQQYQVCQSIQAYLNLVKIGKQNLTSIYFIQPLFKSFFNSIKAQYSKISGINKKKLYRTAKLTQFQLQSISSSGKGRVICNEGFFLASTLRPKGEQIKQNHNVLLQIIIQELQIGQKVDFGFVFSSKNKNVALFNHLNSFRIIHSYKEASIQVVVIEHGAFSKIERKEVALLDQWDLNIKNLVFRLKNAEKVSSLGEALITDSRFLPGCDKYWKKYLQLAKDPTDKLLAYDKLGKIFSISKDKNHAVAAYQKCLEIAKKLNDQEKVKNYQQKVDEWKK